MKQKRYIVFLLLFFLSFRVTSFAQESEFTKQEGERLIRMEATLKVFIKQMDKRFEQVNKRFAELREDMNKRFEQVDKRFEQMMIFLWILVAIFTILTGVVIGFAYWDRRTIIRKARDEAIEVIEKEGTLRNFIRALRSLALEDKRLAEVLINFGLL